MNDRIAGVSRVLRGLALIPACLVAFAVVGCSPSRQGNEQVVVVSEALTTITISGTTGGSADGLYVFAPLPFATSP
jgi:hypothetical protein